jgi:DUF4097 and DUF4098 domain-containing protein YvlB
MMRILGCVACLLLATNAFGQATPPAIQAKPGGPESAPRTDQTVEAAKGTRLVLTNNAGEVVVRTWERDQVRVVASHSERERVNIQTTDMTLRIGARAARGPASLVDYQITVPRWMPVNLTGTYLESTIEGTAAEVTVETVHGNVRVVGGSGSVVCRSVEGMITVEKAAGRVQATGVNEGIRLIDVTGDVVAETTNGDIVIRNAQTSNLEASTVNGDITFNGSVREKGAYRLTTHGGDIRIGLGGATNATVFVRTFQGDFSADFPIQLPEGQSARSGSKRFNFTLGGGSARIEVQSFNGDIHVAKGTIITADELREQRRLKPPKQDLHFEQLGEVIAKSIGQGIGDDIRAEINRTIVNKINWKEHELAFAAWVNDIEWADEVDWARDFEFDFDFDFNFEFDSDLDPFPSPTPSPSPSPTPKPTPTPSPRKPA